MKGTTGTGLDCLLIDLACRGFTLTFNGEKLLVSPAAQLTPEDRARIAEERDELVSMLGLSVECLDNAGLTHTFQGGATLDCFAYTHWRFKGDIGWGVLPRRRAA